MQQINYYPQEELDEELMIDFKKIGFSIRSRRILILKVFFTVFLFLVLSTFITAKKYTVDADLYINKTNNSNMTEINPYFISEVGSGSGMAAMLSGSSGSLTNELELMQSPLVIDKVIKENDLRYKKLFGIFTTVKTGKLMSTEKFLKKKVSFEVKKGTNVVTISYKDKDRELAYGIVNSIIKNYVQLHKELNTEKSKSDKAVLQAEYDSAKANLNKKMNVVGGMPATAISGSGGISALSAFSSAARKAMSSIQGQYSSGVRSEIALQEESEKVAELAKRLEWAKLVDNMSDSSNVVVLKEPMHLADYEQTSPKLFTNIILGIILGIFGSCCAIFVKEKTDKKLPYSMLGNEVIYDIKKDFIDFKSILLANKKEFISCILFEEVDDRIIEELKKFNNINFVKAEISEDFCNDIENSKKMILFAKIGKTDTQLYKQVKQLLTKIGKEILVEVLV